VTLTAGAPGYESGTIEAEVAEDLGAEVHFELRRVGGGAPAIEADEEEEEAEGEAAAAGAGGSGRGAPGALGRVGPESTAGAAAFVALALAATVRSRRAARKLAARRAHGGARVDGV
jgi:hypothetical protein